MITGIEWFYYIIIFCFGLSIGSFMNSWVWRTHENLGIARARSMCPRCRYVVRWYDNIPLLSFFALRGRCRNCERRIIWQYPAVELWSGIMFLAVILWHGLGAWVFSIELFRDLVILVFLTFIFIYDLQYREIFNFATVIPGVALFLTALVFGWQDLPSMLAGVFVGAGFFLLLYLLSKGAWIGGGNVRLGFFMGVILGWPKILAALLFAYIIGAVVSLILVLAGKKTLKSETPFGTYLVVGTMIALFGGEALIKWYVAFL